MCNRRPVRSARAQRYGTPGSDYRAGIGRLRTLEIALVRQRVKYDALVLVLCAQRPKVCVLGCSDSRVPVEIVFDQGLGDIFVIRGAGNVADFSSMASVEYAVQHLMVKVLHLAIISLSWGRSQPTCCPPAGASSDGT